MGALVYNMGTIIVFWKEVVLCVDGGNAIGYELRRQRGRLAVSRPLVGGTAWR